MRLSRRSVLLASAVAVSGCVRETGGAGPASEADHVDDWLTAPMGSPPYQTLLLRVRRNGRCDLGEPIGGFFDRLWDVHALGQCDAVAASAQTELFAFNGPAHLDRVFIVRGVSTQITPQGDFVSRAPSGATQWLCRLGVLFVLPDGTWVHATEHAGRVLAPMFAADARPPPPSPLEPSALIVRRDLGGWGAMIPQESPPGQLAWSRASPRDLVASDSVRWTTTAAFAAAPGTDVPTIVRCEYADSGRAASAADAFRHAYLLARPRFDPRSEEEDTVAYFLQRLQQVTVDARSLALRGALPYPAMARLVG